VTWGDYGQDLEDNLQDLHSRFIAELSGKAVTQGVHTEGRRAAATVGIASLEDKILQRAVVEVLNAIYEATSWASHTGFGPGVGRMMRWMR